MHEALALTSCQNLPAIAAFMQPINISMSTATQTKTETQPQPLSEFQKAVKVEITSKDGKVTTETLVVDTRLTKAASELFGFDKKVGGKYAEMAKLVRDFKLPRKLLVSSLLSVGKTESSAESIASRIMKLSERPDIIEKMLSGAMGEREARYAISKRQLAPAPRRSHEAMANEFLSKAAAYFLDSNRSLEEFVQAANEQWKIAVGDKAERDAKAEKEAANKAAKTTKATEVTV